MKKILFFIAILLFYNQLIFTQYKLSGKINDEAGEPLPGATIFIPELNKGTVADSNGAYFLTGLPAGKLKIQFSFIGYRQAIHTVVFPEIGTELNVTLENAPVKGEEIVISGGYLSSQHENAVKIDVLKLNQVNNNITPNFTEVLTKIPGVDMISKGNGVSKPVIRGLSMDNILILNNGVRNENYQYSSHHPLGISEYGVENVEVIKGPASLLYGSDAVGGVINFLKERPASANSITGDFNTHFFSNSLGIDQNIGFKGASQKISGGIRAGYKSHADYLQGGGDFAPNTRFNEVNFNANTGFTNRTGLFKLFYDYNRQKLGLAEEEAIEQITKAGRKNELYFQQLNTHLISSQNKLFVNKYRIEADAAIQSTELIHIGEQEVTEIDMRLSTFTYEAKLYLPSSEKSEYIAGMQGMNQVNRNIPGAGEILLPDANTNSYGFFGLIQYTFFKKLKLQSGLRYDYKLISTEKVGNESEVDFRMPVKKEFGSISGSLGAVLNFNENFFLRTNFASAYRTPNLAELTSNGMHELRFEKGNRSLSAQRSYEQDLSLHYHTDYMTVDIAGFCNFIKKYIYITPTSDTTREGNIIYKYLQSDATLFGGEAGIHIHPKSVKWFHIESTFSTVRGTQENGDYLPFIPADKLMIEVKLEKEKLAFLEHAFVFISLNSAFKQNRSAPEEEDTDGYSLVNTGVGAKLKVQEQAIIFEFVVNNLMDKKYVDHLSTLKEADLFNPGRNLALSLKVPFDLKK